MASAWTHPTPAIIDTRQSSNDCIRINGGRCEAQEGSSKVLFGHHPPARRQVHRRRIEDEPVSYSRMTPVVEGPRSLYYNLEKRSCQLFYYCVHMAEKTTSLCYVSFYVRCSVFHLGYVSLYVRCSVLDLPTRGSRVLCTCTADILHCVQCMHAVRGSVFGCACARNFLLWNCFVYELFRIFRLMAWLISFRRC